MQNLFDDKKMQFDNDNYLQADNEKKELSLNPQIQQYKDQVMKTVFDIGWRTKSNYRDLFWIPSKNYGSDDYERKIVFKLMRVLKQEVQSKIPYKIYVESISKLKWKYQQGYWLMLKISFLDKDKVIYQWDQFFMWMYYSKDSKAYSFNFMNEAEEVFLSKNKSWFFSLKNGTGQDLRNYFLAKLQNISLDFSIANVWENMYLDLKTIDFQLHVYYQGSWIFDVKITKDASYIYYYGKGNDKSRNNQTFKGEYLIAEDQIQSQFEMVTARMRSYLSNVWERNDTVGEILKSIKYFWTKLFSDQINDLIAISSDVSVDTRLENLTNSENKVDFEIQIRTLDLIKRYRLVNDGIVNFKILELKDEIVNKIENINLALPFLKESKNLYWLIQREMNDVSYRIWSYLEWQNLHLMTKDVHLYVHLKYKEQWYCGIQLYLSQWGKIWKISFIDTGNKNIGGKDEL